MADLDRKFVREIVLALCASGEYEITRDEERGPLPYEKLRARMVWETAEIIARAESVWYDGLIVSAKIAHVMECVQLNIDVNASCKMTLSPLRSQMVKIIERAKESGKEEDWWVCALRLDELLESVGAPTLRGEYYRTDGVLGLEWIESGNEEPAVLG